MRFRHWRDCPAPTTPSPLLEQVIFTRREGAGGERPGAVLHYVDRFGRACVTADTPRETHQDRQRVFFVAEGSGSVQAGDEEHQIRPGVAVLVPAGVAHGFRPAAGGSLELLVVEEALAGPPAPAVLVRDQCELPTIVGHGFYHARRLFGGEDGLTTIGAVLAVGVEPRTAGETHGHGSDTDEVWYMWRGCGYHVVDGRVYEQTPGTAIQVAPSESGHSLLNHTTERLEAFYFAGPERR